MLALRERLLTDFVDESTLPKPYKHVRNPHYMIEIKRFIRSTPWTVLSENEDDRLLLRLTRWSRYKSDLGFGVWCSLLSACGREPTVYCTESFEFGLQSITLGKVDSRGSLVFHVEGNNVSFFIADPSAEVFAETITSQEPPNPGVPLDQIEGGPSLTAPQDYYRSQVRGLMREHADEPGPDDEQSNDTHGS